jgi:lipoic acid synthetase
MVGLGETREEVIETLRDLRSAKCSLLTIGQYLRPSESRAPVHAFITPEEFKRYESIGYDLGFSKVFAGPFVRSSYKAEEMKKIVTGCQLPVSNGDSQDQEPSR